MNNLINCILGFFKIKKGCKYCNSMTQELLDAQDTISGWYCGISDPDHDKENICMEGFSPKIKKHYDNPCEDYSRDRR